MSKNMGNLLKQAQQMQTKVAALQKELETRELEVSSGGGAVKIRVSGKQEILSIELSPECVDPEDVETLEDLVKTGVNQAITESKEMVEKAMSKVTGGLSLPGLF